jgi:hypothetical protein
MNTEPVQGYREIAAVRRIERRTHDETPQHGGDGKHNEHEQDNPEAPGPAVEDLIDHRLELLADHDEPVVLDEDLPPAADDHDLDLLL